MLRLIRSQFWKAEKDFADRYVEVFINPTSKEWDNILENNIRDGARGIIEEDGTLYAWMGGLLHKDAIPLFDIPEGIHINISSKNLIEIYLLEDSVMETLYHTFKNAHSLFNFLSPSTSIENINCSFYGAARDPIYIKLKTLDDILNYQKIEEPTLQTAQLKEAQFFNATNYRDKFIECFINPTAKEWGEMEDVKPVEGVRGVITQDGTVYGWNGYILHRDAIPEFKLPDGVHFSGKDDNIEIYVIPSINPQYIIDAFTNASAFYTKFSPSTNIFDIDVFHYKAHKYEIYNDWKTINDILQCKKQPKEQPQEELKVSRLIKKRAE